MLLDTLKQNKKALAVLAAWTVFCFCLPWCRFAPTVRAGSLTLEAHAAGSDTTAVNLKEGNWVYATYVDRNNEPYASVTGYNGTSLTLEIPSSLGGVPVRAVSREAFVGNKYVTEALLSEGITEIGKYSFQGCVGLRSITLPSTLKSIGDGAFYGCYSLAGAELPDGVTKIGDAAFYGCKHMKNVRLSASLQSIGDDAFANCVTLEEVSFGGSLESVGSGAFHGCASLCAVSLPDTLVSLGEGAFANCSSMTDASLGSGLEEIRGESFRGCSSLKNVSFGGQIRSIGDAAFEDCASLSSFPEGVSVESIGTLAFHRCGALREIAFGDRLQTVGFAAFNGCNSLKKITVSEKNQTFSSNGGMLYTKDTTTLLLCPQGATGRAKIENNTTALDDFAFAGCRKLTAVSLPDSVARIGIGALLNCTDVTRLSVPVASEKLGCLSVGYYFRKEQLKKASYLQVFSGEESATDLYCAAHELSFTAYKNSLVLGTEKAVLRVGDTFTVKYAFLSGRKGSVAWESSDESVVTVKDGTLKALGEGKAVITAVADDYEPRIINVIVTKASDSDSHEKHSYSTKILYCGETEELASLLDQIMDPLLSVGKFWYSSEPGVAKVNDDGRVTALRKGKATIVCRQPDGSEKYLLLTVAEKPVEWEILPATEELAVGSSMTLQCGTVPVNTGDSVIWKSETPSVATVNEEGVVTAISQGNCDITASSESGLQSIITVRCVIPAEELSLNLETRSVYKGKEFNLAPELTPAESRQSIVWRSSDPLVATVNSKGKVKGVSFGTATIYASTASGAQASCVVHVMVKADLLSLSAKELTLNCGTEETLTPVIFPSYSPESTEPCKWNSTDENVATVDNAGKVTATGVGSCIINCRTEGDLIAKCRVTVKQQAKAAELTGDRETVYIGDVTQLRLLLTPTDTTDRVEWTSSDNAVAKVTSNGSVKGKAVGAATVTATVTNDVSGESLTASYEITVLKKAESVRLKKDTLSLHTGDSDAVGYIIEPSDSNDTVIWSSSNEEVATVRDDGLITALRPGSCYISVKTGSGCTARCKLVVSE